MWLHHQAQTMEVLKKSDDDGHEKERVLVTLLLVLTHSSLAALSIDSIAAPCHKIGLSSSSSTVVVIYNVYITISRELLQEKLSILCSA